MEAVATSIPKLGFVINMFVPISIAFRWQVVLCPQLLSKIGRKYWAK